jgi:threonine synthase
MRYVSTRDPNDNASFLEAVLRGAASEGGLYVPVQVPRLDAVSELLKRPLAERSAAVCAPWIGDDLTPDEIAGVCSRAFSFPAPVVQLSEQLYVLELFHGPTLAFKDFGARFMAQVLGIHQARSGTTQPITILTATSGDTGAAVAHAFYGVPGVDVRVLYPAGRISDLQERLFCGLGGNVTTYRVDGSFDDCQAMVKACFRDPALTSALGLTSANSINISRLIAQCVYYFEGAAQLDEPAVFCVPSGNFGNITAGMFAREMGLPIRDFVCATNRNHVVPSFMETGHYQPMQSVQTLSNAMDVGNPSNWERIRALYGDTVQERFRSSWASDAQTVAAMQRLHQEHQYVADPHTAVGAHVLKECLRPGERAILLSTAHPAKFQSAVEDALGIAVPLPPALAAVADQPVLSIDIPAEREALVHELLR